MTLPSARIRKLRALRRANRLEVEHVVEIAVHGGQEDVALLEELIDEGAGELLQPWKLAAIAYLRGGYDALRAHADAATLPFVLGLLEELKTIESVSVVLELVGRYPAAAERVTTALNLVLSFQNAPTLTSAVEARVRLFLHDQVLSADSEPRRAVAILALRRTGDESTLELLASQRDFASPYHNTLAIARREIHQRLEAKRMLH